MGAGWTLNYFSTLIVSDCYWTVVGGDGSGQRFTKVNDSSPRRRDITPSWYRIPTAASISTLRAGFAITTWTERFLKVTGCTAGGRHSNTSKNPTEIEFGFTTTKTIGPSLGWRKFLPKICGRSLSFEYELVRGEPRVSAVNGPLGLRVDYDYDQWANLE